tara:strand:- start:847 stop:1242 length:396 start_codon:yes stop_codon:yes gene_type:complete
MYIVSVNQKVSNVFLFFSNKKVDLSCNCVIIYVQLENRRSYMSLAFLDWKLKKQTVCGFSNKTVYDYGPYQIKNNTAYTYANWNGYLDGKIVAGPYATRAVVVEQIKHLEYVKYENDPDRSRRIIEEMMND